MRLSDARTTDEILAAAANFAWYEARKAERLPPNRIPTCPTDRMPTEANLCDWLPLLAPADAIKAGTRLVVCHV